MLVTPLACFYSREKVPGPMLDYLFTLAAQER